jgi:hypothetical protein
MACTAAWCTHKVTCSWPRLLSPQGWGLFLASVLQGRLIGIRAIVCRGGYRIWNINRATRENSNIEAPVDVAKTVA